MSEEMNQVMENAVNEVAAPDRIDLTELVKTSGVVFVTCVAGTILGSMVYDGCRKLHRMLQQRKAEKEYEKRWAAEREKNIIVKKDEEPEE